MPLTLSWYTIPDSLIEFSLIIVDANSWRNTRTKTVNARYTRYEVIVTVMYEWIIDFPQLSARRNMYRNWKNQFGKLCYQWMQKVCSLIQYRYLSSTIYLYI